MTRCLVIARVGCRSLHPGWLDRGPHRDWDLHLAPYQAIPSRHTAGCVTHDVIPGPKWSGLRRLLADWDGWREYDYIWLPDDDIRASHLTISRMFEVARTVRLDLFAPALDEASHYAHYSTMRNRSFYGRRAGFVEIMVPGFSRAALEELLPTLELTETGWGWGLDSVWPKLLGYENVGIIDGTPVVHTRPVGVFRDADLARRVLAESDAVLERYDCRQVHTTFGAFESDGTGVELSPDDLLVELVKGWEYLLDRNPRALAWMVDQQRRLAPCPEYPTAGTPGQAAGIETALPDLAVPPGVAA